MASLQAYQLLSQTLLQCIDLTLHTVTNTGSAHCAVSVSTPALFAVLHSSHAVRWLGSWILTSAASVPPVGTSEVSMSSDVGDMTQLAADMSTSDAAHNRVELFLGAVTRRISAATPYTQQPRFREDGVGDTARWYPSATYPIAVHTVLVHVLSRMVHVAAPDTLARILPYEEEGGARLELWFCSTKAEEPGTWPQWLGPQADLQGLLDGFGVSISQREREAAPDKTHSDVIVTIELRRPRSVDLLSNLPVHAQSLPLSPVQELPLVEFQPQLVGRSVHVVSAPDAPADLLAAQVSAFAAGWGCRLTDTDADYTIIHENLDALRRALATRTQIVYLAHLAHLEDAVSVLGASPRLSDVAFVPTPVCALRALWALYMSGIPGCGSLFVSERAQRHASQSAEATVRGRAGVPLAQPVRITSTWAQQGSHMPGSPRTVVAAPRQPETPSAGLRQPDTPSAAVSRHTVDYFSAAVSRLSERSNAPSGLLIRDCDGRAAGIFFNPASEAAVAEAPRRASTPQSPKSRRAPAGLAIQIEREDPSGGPLNTELLAEPAELLLGKLDAAGNSAFPSGHVIEPAGFSAILRSPKQARLSDPAVPPQPARVTPTGHVLRPRMTAPAVLASAASTKGVPAPQQRAQSIASPGAWPDSMGRLPLRLRGASAQPQSGMMIGGQGNAGAGAGMPSAPESAEPSAAVISHLQRRNKALRELVLPPIKVLIVEDNVINQRILATFLRQKRIQYQVASDGRMAIEMWRSGDFHLILMDIQLPVLDGIEATKEIRRLEGEMNAGATPNVVQSPLSPVRHSVIIVALTASVLISDRVAALAAGCNDFLNKPVSLPWLQRKILEWGSMQYLLHAGISQEQPEKQRSARRSFRLATEAHANSVASNLRLNAPSAQARSGSGSSI